MSGTARQRLERWGPYGFLALLAYVPLFLAKRGTIGADTKVYLYLDPGRLMRTATSMWDPGVGMGTVTHQTIGYLFPMGPYYWLTQHVGIPDWVAQRLWLGCCLFAAGAGMIYLLRTLAWRGSAVVIASMAYLLSPYFLDYAAKHSVIALPWSGLPWLLAFTIRSIRHGGWRDPALFALTVQVVGGINAPSLALVGMACLLWLPFAVWVNREATWRQIGGVVVRIGALTTITSLWWMSGLYAQGGYGIDILHYTETAKTVANASTAPEVLRGLGYWFFYGTDKFGNFVDVGGDYTQRLWLVALSFGIPLLAFCGVVIARFRERAFFVSCILVGTVLSVGAHPWDDPPAAAGLIKAVLNLSLGEAIRSLPRAVPLIALGLSVCLGAGVTAVAKLLPRRGQLAAVGLVGILILANNPPLFTGGLLASGLSRPNDIPSYWRQDAAYLDSQGSATRVLEVPGSDFASYRWGTTVDPVTPGLMDRPYVARELIPYGSAPSADLLNAFDGQLQLSTLSPKAVAPIARFMGVGDLNVRSDLTYERYGLPRPRNLWAYLTSVPGLGTPVGFGGNAPNVPVPALPLQDELELQTDPNLPNPPKVAVIPVKDPQPIIRAAASTHPVVLAGDGEGLVDTAAAGLLEGRELVLYAGSFAKKTDALRTIIGGDKASLVLTDTNRKRALRWGTVADTTGVTERIDETPLRTDPSDNRLPVFPDATDADYTVVDQGGGVTVSATAYGNPISYTPEDRPANALDDSPLGGPDLTTSWRVGGFSPVSGEALRITYAQPQTVDHLTLSQNIGGVQNRYITKIGLRFDGGPEVPITLGEASRTRAGEVVTFPKRTFRTLDLVIHDTVLTIPGVTVQTLRSYDGISAVGFSNIEVGTNTPRVDETIALPQTLLAAAGKAAATNPLAIVLTRLRVRPSSAVRSDEEIALARSFVLPSARGFSLTGEARLSAVAGDKILDRVLGEPSRAQGGNDVTGSRRLPGDLTARASSALDGDPTTWWSPGFLGQDGESIRVERSTPVTFDHLDLQVLNDGRHTVPTSIKIERCAPTRPGGACNGTTVATVPVPPIADVAQPNHSEKVHLSFPAITGSDLRFVIGSTREVKTTDWYSEKPIVMPVGIVELGIPGVAVPRPTGQVDPACRSGLLSVDGRDVPISLHGTVADAEAGKPLTIVPCLGPTGLQLAPGRHVVRSMAGYLSGISVDQLVLRSATGKVPGPTTGTLVTPAQAAGPKVTVTHSGAADATVTVAPTDQRFWLAFGQSWNPGWTATADGKDLGAPTLVNGYGNGWLVSGTGKPVVVKLRWQPQTVVEISLWASAVGVLLCVGLVLWPMRRRLAPVAREDRGPSLDPEPSLPRAFSLHRILRYAGAQPPLRAAVVAVLTALIGFGAIIGPEAGVLLAIVTLLVVRFPRARTLTTIGGPLLLALTGAYVVLEQARQRYPISFEWPANFSAVHQVAWCAVALIVIDVFVDRLWLRRWWPTDDSPE